MSEVIRIFVEKKDGFNVLAKQTLWDIRHNLGMKSVEDLRYIVRYDLEGLTKEEYDKAKTIVLSEPNADVIYEETLPVEDGWKVFAMEYLPGQYDQRGDSAEQCVQLLTQGERCKVLTARVIALKGNITDEELVKVEEYLINPVESRLASLEKPKTLDMEIPVPENVKRVEGFNGWNDDEMQKYYDSMGFAMTLADLKFCRDYFRDTEHRDPSVTELRVIDTYWSDHCRHTTFLTRLEEIEIEKSALGKVIEDALSEYYATRDEVYGKDTKRIVSLMDMALIGMKSLKKKGLIPDLDESEEINACSIQVPVTIDGKTEQWLVQFKNETHNHPTEIEPFGGAATCLGGAIRDPLSGRSYVYQAMRVTGSGDPTIPFKDTMHGKLPSRKITTGAAQGYSSYGNQIGLATGQVTELYDQGYVAKRMEIGAVIGASPKENVIRETPLPDDVIVLLGGRTGRDGCGGAGSSKAHDESSIETCGAEVQKGNPPTERKIQRLFRNSEVAKLIKRCNDFGAGGVCVAIGELADGLTVDLDKVTKKYDGLDGTELAISESQERMAVVLDKKDVDKFISLASKENLEATAVAVVTESPRLTMNWRGDTIVDLSREFLNTNGVTQVAKAYIEAPKWEGCYRKVAPAKLKDMPADEAFLENMSRLEVCSQIGLAERFDASIGAATVIMPFGGKNQLTPQEAMAAKIPLEKGETDDATAMSYGYIPGVSRWSPFHGSAYAVVESLSKLLAIGANPMTARLTFQEYFERLKDVPSRWGKPAAALLGAMQAQLKLGLPSIGGKDSMSGTFEDIDVPPTLVSFAVAMTKASKTISTEFKNAGSKVIFVPVPENKETLMPVWDKLIEMYNAVYALCEDGKVLSASVVKEGGTAASVCKACFGNGFGFKFANELTNDELFAPLSGSLVIELADGAELSNDVLHYDLGTVTNDAKITVNGKEIELSALLEKWTAPLEKVFPTKAEVPEIEVDVPLYSERNTSSPAIKVAKPTVFIPVFPGTNCEVDTARAFEKAGANVEMLIVKNLSSNDIEETIDEMEKLIAKSQMIMLPGGFSGGDEPDGSGKFIATTFRNPRIAEQVNNLLKNRDGLMLGICNGFQALIKLGLVPYGEIRELKANDPTLTFNTIGRHISHMAYTRVTSVKSPWFANVNAGDVFAVPVSHGEGRFMADVETVKELAKNGQIATQYVDLAGNPSSDIEFNLNGSVCAIEGITSPDGRVLGKMGHSERKGENLYKNVPFAKDQQIFESGVKYFK
jgi:phosphoribosylformylglycinamidine synthase